MTTSTLPRYWLMSSMLLSMYPRKRPIQPVLVEHTSQKMVSASYSLHLWMLLTPLVDALLTPLVDAAHSTCGCCSLHLWMHYSLHLWMLLTPLVGALLTPLVDAAHSTCGCTTHSTGGRATHSTCGCCSLHWWMHYSLHLWMPLAPLVDATHCIFEVDEILQRTSPSSGIIMPLDRP